MPMRTITPRQLPGEIRRLARRMPRSAIRGLRNTGVKAHAALVARTSNWAAIHGGFSPVASGEYRMKWKHGTTATGGRVWNESMQAAIVEFGVRPGRIPLPDRPGGAGPAPFPSLVRWAYLKFKQRMGFKKTSDAFGLAVAIQRKLHYHGIDARPVLTEPAFIKRLERMAGNQVVKAVRADLRRA